ncbi:MAG: hypothetical protein JWP22_4194 [Ramlibacter sp.]|nr:hypothetical protein [Ramlibacter sp.]
MIPGELKPILASLVLPPAGPLLLALLALLLARRHRGFGILVAALAIVATLALSTNGMAVILARHLLPPMKVAQPQDLRDVQAIVVLGGGVVEQAPEYGAAQPTGPTLNRLRYGAWLARQTGKPLAFAGGIGWAASGTDVPSEGSVARRVLQEEYGLTPRWVDDQSRDTVENAQRIAALLRPAGVRRIALVTEATHMPRALLAFRDSGLQVVPAPTNLPAPLERPLLEWLPSGPGASTNRILLREWLARHVARMQPEPGFTAGLP